MFVRELQDGLRGRPGAARARRRAAAPPDGGEYLRLTLGDRTGTRPRPSPGTTSRDARALRPGRARRARHRPLRRRTRATARSSTSAGLRAGRRGASTTSPTCSTARRARPSRWRPTCASSSATVQDPHLRTAARARLRRGLADLWPAYRDAPAAKHYHQAYRHGLLEHSLARRPGGQRDQRDVPRHRPRRRGHRRAAARHRQARGLRRTSGAIIDLTDAGRLQGEIPLGYYRVRRAIEDLDGFPRRARAGGAAHHPQPPRLARARQPGRPVHARGDARAHDRQPRRAAGQLRPAREGAAAGSAGRASTARSAAGAYFAAPAAEPDSEPGGVAALTGRGRRGGRRAAIGGPDPARHEPSTPSASRSGSLTE